MASVLVVVFFLPADTPPIRTHDGSPVPGSIATLEPVEVNGSEQWLLIRGCDRTAPELLFVPVAREHRRACGWRTTTTRSRTTSWSPPGSSAARASRMQPAAPTQRR